MSAQQTPKNISGYIVTAPGKESEDGVRVALQSNDGTEYFIIPKGMGIDLMEHINAMAEVSGLVEERGGAKFIMVRNYTVKDGFEDDWYDDKD